jgi:hypothetical protein
MGALVTVYSALLGAVFGVIWPAVAPHVNLIRSAEGSEASATSVLGDDVWFLMLGIGFGIVAALLVVCFGGELGRGPGAVIGLVAGGIVAAIVAARLGYHIQQPKQLADLRRVPPQYIQPIMHAFGFKVRAFGVMVGWPIAAVVVHAGTVIGSAVRGVSD